VASHFPGDTEMPPRRLDAAGHRLDMSMSPAPENAGSGSSDIGDIIHVSDIHSHGLRLRRLPFLRGLQAVLADFANWTSLVGVSTDSMNFVSLRGL
jgi:hypothetical protein